MCVQEEAVRKLWFTASTAVALGQQMLLLLRYVRFVRQKSCMLQFTYEIVGVIMIF